MPKRVTPDFSYLQRNLDDKTEIVYDGQPLCNPFVTEYGYTVYTCFFTVKDYKELVKCSEQTARRTFAQEDFPSFDFGKTLLVEIHAFMEYMQQAHSRKDALSFAPNVITHGTDSSVREKEYLISCANRWLVLREKP